MKRALASMVATGVLLLAGSAAAQDPAWTLGKPQVSAQLNYGIGTGDNPGDINPYGIGLGLKGGYTLDPSIYIGATFDYFFGGSEEAGGSEVSLNTWMLQGEVGYDLAVMPEAVLRPKVGLGLTSVSGEACVRVLNTETCGDDSITKFSLAPGAQFLYSLDNLFITADARYNIAFTGDDEPEANAFIIGAGVGMAF